MMRRFLVSFALVSLGSHDAIFAEETNNEENQNVPHNEAPAPAAPNVVVADPSNNNKIPTQKFSSIFPASNVPSDMKESWQQHLVEQFAANDDVTHKTRDARFQGDFAFSGEEDVLDERTLLDVFGEAAKEFLTQRVVRGMKECLSKYSERNRPLMRYCYPHVIFLADS